MKDRLGRCYELSAEFVLENEDWVLVHGWIKDELFGSGNQIPHAWCEKNFGKSSFETIVYDPVIDQGFQKPIYQGLFKTTEDVRYTYDETEKLMKESGHYGRWHEIDEDKIICNKVPGL